MEFSVEYMLGSMYHQYIIEVENEAEVITKAIRRIPAKEIMHDFKVKKYVQEWN